MYVVLLTLRTYSMIQSMYPALEYGVSYYSTTWCQSITPDVTPTRHLTWAGRTGAGQCLLYILPPS